MTDIADYDYILPKELIAQHPANPRETARMMVLPKGHELIHDVIGNFPTYIHPGDVVVINNSKVFNARLDGIVSRSDVTKKRVELFLIKPTEQFVWQCIGKPGKIFTIGTIIHIADDFQGTVVAKHSDGTFSVSFSMSPSHVIEQANRYGSVPLPPYITQQPLDGDYQTVYAKKIGSVAAPTAGFHITNSILTQLRSKGVQIVEITLHVGLGTFLPIKSNIIEEHTMHSEWVEITQEACDAITIAKQENKRIIAIGTTTARALEGSYVSTHSGSVGNNLHTPGVCNLVAFSGEVNIFITPGFTFNIIDCLLTNFHLPKSTLLLLVSAFAGKEKIKKAYQEAVNEQYRFFSFGDAMFLEKDA